jgi:hypothetical protein
MAAVDFKALKTYLDNTLLNKLCVQAWLGYANVLFIGFGDTVIPPTPKGSSHPIPLYELQFDFCDWWIEDQTRALIQSDYSDRDKIIETIEMLVGKKMECWSFIEPKCALELTFETGIRLKMTPYLDGETTDPAWSLRLENGAYFCVDWSGNIILKEE